MPQRKKYWYPQSRRKANTEAVRRHRLKKKLGINLDIENAVESVHQTITDGNRPFTLSIYESGSVEGGGKP